MKTINTALLSFGMSGKVFHAPFIQLHPGFHLAGAWERSKKLIQTAYPGTHSYSTLEEVLADDTIDLIVVNTPVYTHYEYTKRAFEAGKHVVVEKAFTANTAEAEALKTLATKQGKQLAVYQNRRWDSDFLTVKRVIDSGLLGSLQEVEFHYDRYNLELSYKTHKEEKNSGSGLLKDLGPHIIDQALFMFGMPEALFADIRTIRPASVVEDYFDVLLLYPTLRVRLKASLIVKEPLPSYIVHGTNGSFLKTRADVQEPKLIAGAIPEGTEWGREPETEKGVINYLKDGQTVRATVDSEQGKYMEFYNGVYTALSENKTMPVTVDDGIRVMQIIDAAYQSYETKSVIRF